MKDEDLSLRPLQRRFQSYLVGTSEDFIQDVVSSENALAEHRLAAYYNAYRARLISSLANDFEVLQQELGETEFELMVLEYLKQYPSEHPSVRWVGKNMVTFLEGSSYENKSFLAELAKFEWYQGLCFDSIDPEQLFSLENMASIASNDWPNLIFKFNLSLYLVDFNWNIPKYWLALNNQEVPSKKQFSKVPTRWLMWRKDLSPNWRSLEAAEAWAIEAAITGANFAEICEGLLEWLDTDFVAVSAASFLKQWIEDGLIVELKGN